MNFTFKHDGKPHPQGRPKITTKPFPKVYYSGPSTAYRKELVKAFTATREGYEGMAATGQDSYPAPFPLSCVEVHLSVWGLRRNADPDNMAKQVLDALVTAGVLAGDEWPMVPVLVVRCFPASGADGKVHVTLIPYTYP